MAFVRFPADRVKWSTPPDIFASSNLVERGFCSKCGTPLSYRQTSGPNISLTLNSLDDPEAARPEMKFSANTEVSWCGLLADLPDNEMDVTSVPGFVNYQHKIGRLEVHTSEPQAFSNHGMSLSRNSNAKFILATNRIDQ